MIQNKYKKNMKNLLCIALSVCIFSLLFFSDDANILAKEGLLNWFQNMIPTLFPFMVIQSMAINTDFANVFGRKIGFVLKPIFKLNINAYYAILAGFLFGFPMGAVAVRDLYLAGKISKTEAEVLLCFTNLLGPVYFISHILPIVPDKQQLLCTILMYGMPFLYGILLCRKLPPKTHSFQQDNHRSNKDLPHLGRIFQKSLSSATSSIVYLGGCMIVFNMMRLFPNLLWGKDSIPSLIACGLLEIGSYVHHLNSAASSMNPDWIILLLSAVPFGGLSCLIQTVCILEETDLSIRKYFFHKVMQSTIWLIVVLSISFFF